MTHNRHQQNHRQNNGYQQSRYQQQDPNRYRRQDLEREQRQLQGRLAELEADIDALGAQGRLLEADIQAHNRSIPAAVALEIGRAMTKAIGIPFLPSAYRNWHYKRERMLQIQSNLKYRAVQLFSKREALVQRIEQITIELDLLKYS